MACPNGVGIESLYSKFWLILRCEGQWHAPNGVGIESLYLKFWLILRFCSLGNGRLALLDRGLYRLKLSL